ncbi:MAG TPA: hypothetical protein VGJ01_10335 [Pseudolabrys sp.]|jgi:hypothetical protein
MSVLWAFRNFLEAFYGILGARESEGLVWLIDREFSERNRDKRSETRDSQAL